jgi:hypothetical protein
MNFALAILGTLIGFAGVSMITRRKLAQAKTHAYLDRVIRGYGQSTEVRSSQIH